jgi:copper chaperone
MEKKVLKVTGMSCEHCVKAVKNALGELDGLSDVSVDLKSGAVSFMFDPAKTPLEKIREAITEAGYEAAG